MAGDMVRILFIVAINYLKFYLFEQDFPRSHEEYDGMILEFFKFIEQNQTLFIYRLAQ